VSGVQGREGKQEWEERRPVVWAFADGQWVDGWVDVWLKEGAAGRGAAAECPLWTREGAGKTE
jgi:hypothetical protein